VGAKEELNFKKTGFLKEGRPFFENPIVKKTKQGNLMGSGRKSQIRVVLSFKCYTIISMKKDNLLQIITAGFILQTKYVVSIDLKPISFKICKDNLGS